MLLLDQDESDVNSAPNGTKNTLMSDSPASPVDTPASPVDTPASPVDSPASPVDAPATGIRSFDSDNNVYQTEGKKKIHLEEIFVLMNINCLFREQGKSNLII